MAKDELEPVIRLDTPKIDEPVVIRGNEAEESEDAVNLEVGKRSGSARVIHPEARPPEKRKEADFSDVDNPKLQRLAAISGRTLAAINPLHEGDIAWGFLNLLNVDTDEQITLFPDAKVPEGVWVPVNLIPQEYLLSLK